MRRLPPLPLPEPPRTRSSPIRSALLVMLLIGFTSAFVGGTAAVLNATTTNPGFIATASLPGPTGPLTAAPSTGNGPDMSLAWTNGGLGSGNEYEIYRSNGASTLATTAANCPTNAAVGAETSYTSGAAIGNASGTPLTDTGPETMTSTSNGYLCYMLFSAFTSGSVPSAPTWLSHPVASPWNPTAGGHLPLRVISVIFKDITTPCVGNTCTFDNNDLIQLTYNQPTTAPAIAGNTAVCMDRTTGNIWLGASYNGPANTCGNDGQLGAISPPSAGCGCYSTANAGKDPEYKATYTWNPAAATNCPTTGTTNNTVLCIKVQTGPGSKNTPFSFTDLTSSWTLQPSTTANVQSNDASSTDRVSVCTSAVAACQPSTTTRP